jgi:hypothetical protein
VQSKEGDDMPKKLYEEAGWPYKRQMILDEEQPHALAEFVEESLR